MRSRIPGIRAAAYGAMWAMRADRIEALLDFIDLRADGRTLPRSERIAKGIQATREGRGGTLRTVGQIAVLPIKGVIANHAGVEMDISGGTSTVALGRALAEAMNTPDVSAIVFDIDSPGGTIEGVPELAASIYAARGKGKKLIASVNAHCHSAAYWLASQCDEVCITPSGSAGDIGVYTIRTDVSAAERKAGVSRTLIKAGKYKGEGNPSLKATEEELDARAEEVLEIYGLFTADVAKGRNVTVAQVEGGMGEGRSLRAKQAKAEGLVDRIETLDQTIARLGGATQFHARRPMLSASRQIDAQMRADAHEDVAPEICPECDEEMQDRVCPECGYTAPDESPDDASDPAQAVAVAAASRTGRTAVAPEPPTLIPIVAGATLPGATEPPIPTTISQEHQVPDNPTPTLAELQATARVEAAARARDISALCEAHNITASAAVEFISSDKTVAQVGLAIAEQKRSERAANPNIRVGADLAADRPFDTLGEQLVAIARHNDRSLGEPDKRLYAAVTTGGASANVGADGAFAIQKDFTSELFRETIEGGDLLSKCDTTEIGANADGLEVLYIDETSRATGSRWGGVQVYRASEADTPTAKKPKFGKWESRLEDIIGLAYMTSRLLQDAASVASVFATAFVDEIQFTAENELVRGTGVGQMAGIVGHAATVSVAKEAGQAADTILAENIMSMWKCVHPRSRLRGAWYYNVECEPQLQQMQIGTGASGQLVYMPPGGLSNAQFGAIYGRPAIPIEYASGLGDVGDIFFADWSKYKVITKGGVQSDESIHVGFIKNELTYRWITRINGAPKLKAALTPFKATDANLKLSPFVTLAAR